MKIGTFINNGTMIEINGLQTMNLSIDKGEVRIAKDGTDVLPSEPGDEPAQAASDGSVGAEDADIEACLPHFTDGQAKAAGIRMQGRVVLALMEAMRPQCTQKISWLMYYCVLLRRGWMEPNVSAYCRLVQTVFGVELDNHNLSKLLAQHGTDYTRWTEADVRIKAHKAFAAEFDRRLTEYFMRNRARVMEGITGG